MENFILLFLALGGFLYFMMRRGGGCCGGHDHGDQDDPGNNRLAGNRTNHSNLAQQIGKTQKTLEPEQIDADQKYL